MWYVIMKICHISYLLPHISYLIHPTSYLIPPTSYLLPHTSYLIPHTSYLISHIPFSACVWRLSEVKILDVQPMQRNAVINIVGLTERVLGPHTPRISAFRQSGASARIVPVLPAV